MFDFQNDLSDMGAPPDPRAILAPVRAMPRSKRMFDVLVAALLLPLLGVCGLVLLVLNPVFNHGPLLFRQRRMGYATAPFVAFKFRSMQPVRNVSRGAFDRLEEDRITRFGRVIRQFRIDELPQIINVLRGDMSLIGPRPDLYDHACDYQQIVPGYAARYQILPGISGYAQTEVGYVDGLDGIRQKVRADLYYIDHATLWLDLWIAWRTVCVVIAHKGR